jgi:hypothetical protein
MNLEELISQAGEKGGSDLIPVAGGLDAVLRKLK